MKSLSIAVALAALTLVGAPAASFAQETKTARGTVSIVADDSLTIKMPGQEMKFAVDTKTTVEIVGGSTRTRQAQQAGQPGPKLTEVLKAGQPVTVSYKEANGVMHAESVRAISSLGAGARAGAGSESAQKTINGLVNSVSPTSLIVSGSGGVTETFTFSIDGSTKVVGTGAGTATAAAGGKVPVTDLVKRGDKVSVAYHTMGSTLHAAEIRVTAKGIAK